MPKIDKINSSVHKGDNSKLHIASQASPIHINADEHGKEYCDICIAVNGSCSTSEPPKKLVVSSLSPSTQASQTIHLDQFRADHESMATCLHLTESYVTGTILIQSPCLSIKQLYYVTHHNHEHLPDEMKRNPNRGIPITLLDALPIDEMKTLCNVTGRYILETLFVADRLMWDILHAVDINDGEWLEWKLLEFGKLLCANRSIVEILSKILAAHGYNQGIDNILIPFLRLNPCLDVALAHLLQNFLVHDVVVIEVAVF